jgi:hypothetical protein
MWIAYGTTLAISWFLFSQLSSMATPKYSTGGELLSAGFDLDQPGLTGYMRDVVYITWFVHVTTTLISEKFWFTFLVVRIYTL